MRRLLAIAVCLAACSKSDDKPPAPVEPPAPVDAAPGPQKMTDVDAFAKIVIAGAQRVADAGKTGDCAKFKAAYEAFTKTPITLDASKKQEFETKYGSQIEQILIGSRDVFAQCEGSAAGNVHDAKHADEFGPKFLAVSKKMSAAIAAANGDCKKMGDSLKPIKAELLALNKISPTGDADKSAFDKKYGKQIEAALAPARAGIDKCHDHPAMKEFMAMF